MGPKRPVTEAQATGQLSLVDQPKSSQEESCETATDRELTFKEGDPESIWFGDKSLRAYLEAAELGHAFLIRELLESLEWSEFEQKYSPGGRPPYAPRVMMGLILYGLTEGTSSLRGLEKLARQDLVCQWITGGLCPDHATIGRFINLHKETISGSFFERLTARIVKHLPEVDRELAGDGTTMEAAASRYKSLKLEAAKEAARETRAQANRHPDDANLQREAAQAEAVAEEAERRGERREERRRGKAEETRIHPEEPDAYYHRLKNGQYRYGYVPSIVVNRQRMIVGQTVDPAKEIDVVDEEIDQAEAILGEIERLSLDANYFCFDILETALERELDLLCPAPETVSDREAKKFPKSAFAYDPGTDTCRCPAGETMERRSSGYDEELDQPYAYYATSACNEGCPLRDQCTESERGRRIKRWEADELKDAARWVMTQPKAQEAYRHRNGSVEPVFGELRHIQGLERFHRKGTEKVSVEFALHASAHNLRRLKTLMGASPEVLEERFGEAGPIIWAYFVQIEWRIRWTARQSGIETPSTCPSHQHSVWNIGADIDGQNAEIARRAT